VPATVLENIVDYLATTLEGITVDNDFDFDMQEVERFETEGNSLLNLPKSVIATMPQRRLLETNRHVEWEVDVWIQHFLLHDKAADSRSTDEILIEHRNNLYKALMSDRTCGGHAVLLTVEEMSDFDLETEQGRDTGVNLQLGIRFRHLVGDPWTQA
jgi:hypothetical protein